MDLSELTNVEPLVSTILDKNHLSKDIPVLLHEPSYSRNLSSTGYIEFDPRQTNFEYSDCRESLHSIDEPSTSKLISWTNASSNNDDSVCYRASTDLKTNISIYKNFEEGSFKNTEENNNQPISKSTVIDINYKPESEQFEMHNANAKKEESDMVDTQFSFATQDTFENLFASNIKATVESLPVFEEYDKTKNSSLNIPDDVKEVRSNVEKCNETSNLSIGTSNNNLLCSREVSDNIKKESDDDSIMQKILDLANVHVNVTFKAMLTELYRKKYSEHIPSTVLQEINFLVSVNNESKIKDVTSSNKEVVNIGPTFLTSEDIGSKVLVKIYDCKSITEIWGKIMNATNLQKLDELLKEMKKFYDSEKMVASSIKEGGFYAVYKDDFWHRVKCLKCDKSTALVLFIDQGDEYTFSLENIFELHNKFVLMPAQAIKMSLSDLEDISDCYEAFIILKDKLLEKTVCATMLQYKDNCCNVKLYLKIYEENINIADLVIEQLFKTFLNPKSSIQTEELMPVHVSSINERSIFVQLIESKSFTYFMKLLKNVVTKYLGDENVKHEPQLNKNKMYLVKSPKTEKWYRAKILNYKSENQVELSLIDTGKKISIKQGNLFPLEKFSSILTKYPEQAIEVQVHELSSFYEDEHETLKHFRKLMKNINTFLASFVMRTLSDNIPTIRLLKKESDGSLTAINDELLFNQIFQIGSTIAVPLKKSESSDNIITLQQKISNMQVLLRSALSLMSLSTVLDPPQIPNDFLDVHVISTNNPSNFAIQLLPNKCELKKLECELSDACNSYKGPLLTVDSVKIGQLYAAKYNEYDNKWYRVYVCQLMTDTKSANVYYCDYGYYKEVKIENIVPLVTQFRQLPYQAVWAELYGIKPIFERWTIDDASRFKDLAHLKKLIGINRGKKSFKPTSYGALTPITVETVYSLELVDTSTADDIYIADILVNEKRALKSS
ncbi:tudor domain-containing protein 7 isoform X1 [Nasonia vitripennis]|uniref:Tudor domain-containing protein n=1 Tax=Nasonia vitripennis TaxID=7425 RepID=A0A7M7LRX9_NASVI|nr:tudor domain-containing protein 7 isoform X1 [Nasonia vitripennis]